MSVSPDPTVPLPESTLSRVLEPEVMDDPEESADYAGMDHSVPNAAVVKRLLDLDLMRLSPSASVLDLGTGPGDIPKILIDALPTIHVTAVDAAATMLELARVRLRDAIAHGQATLVQADVKALPFADDVFDGVFSNTILHHLADPGAMLREARRVLRPGGILMIRDLFRPRDERAVECLVDQHAPAVEVSETHRQLLRQSLQAALSPAELRRLANECGLAMARVVVDTDRHVTLQQAAAL